jgi:hypothetical protein
MTLKIVADAPPLAVRKAQLPAKVRRPWSDFDDLVADARRLRELIGEAVQVCDAIDERREAGLNLAPTSAHAEDVAERFRKIAPALCKRVNAASDHYDGDDMYDWPKGHHRADLCGCHSDFVIKRRVVSEHLELLIGSFPNFAPASPETYVRMLTEEILAAKPKVRALESTCREIRRSMTFVPSVAEFLKVLRRQMQWWSDHEYVDRDDIRYWQAKLDSRIAELKAKQTGENP